jgi:hypothetical protein
MDDNIAKCNKMKKMLTINVEQLVRGILHDPQPKSREAGNVLGVVAVQEAQREAMGE